MDVVFQDDKCFINPDIFDKELKDKVPEEISNGMKYDVLKQVKYKQLELSLLNNCKSIGCNYDNSFKSMGYGDINSNVMVINLCPNEFEIATNISMSSPENFFLLCILNYCGIKYYRTDIVKCILEYDNSSACTNCINNYLLKEIEIIQPRLIICNGMDVLNLLKNYNIININKNLCYGEICQTTTCNNINTNVITLYNSKMVLNKTGNDYVKCKNELWAQARIIKKFLEE